MEKCIVYLPVYNGEAFVRETVESVLGQDYPNFQVVICDDCSSDSSEDIIQSYLEKYPDKIIYHKNTFNLGVGTTLHNCYENHHNARFFAQIGHDDVWPKSYLSEQIWALKESGATVSFANNDYIDENGQKKDGVTLFYPELIETLPQPELFLRLVRNNFLCAPASVVDLSKLEDPDEVTTFWGYNNDRLQDCELWLNLCLLGRFHYNRDTKIQYRVHTNNLSNVTKRILQGKLEYYTMMCRVLNSKHFYEFLESSNAPEKQIDGLLDALSQNIAYSNPVKLLIINLCEMFLNLGYSTEKIKYYMNWLYMDTGLITKCQKGNRNLVGKIGLVIGGTIRSAETVMSLGRSGNFEILADMNHLNEHCLCVTQEENLEYLMNWPPFYYNFMHGQVVLFSQRERVKSNKKMYPNFLVVPDDIGLVQLERAIYQFVEDGTHIFRNGFFDLVTGYGYPDYGYNKVRVELSAAASVRAVDMIDALEDEPTFWEGENEIAQVESDQAKYFLEENVIRSGVLTIESKNGIGLKDRIVINNTLYICRDVIMLEDESVVPVFAPMSYYNNSHAEKSKSRGDMFAMMASNVGDLMEAKNELVQIKASFSYAFCEKLKESLRKLHLYRPVESLVNRIHIH